MVSGEKEIIDEELRKNIMKNENTEKYEVNYDSLAHIAWYTQIKKLVKPIDKELTDDKGYVSGDSVTADKCYFS